LTALALITDALKAAGPASVVEYRGGHFDGAALLSRIRARANDLHSRRLAAGDTALIVVTDNLSAVEQLIACWMVGASGFLLDFRTTPARIGEWSQRLSPTVMLGVRPSAGLDLHLQPRDTLPADQLDFPAADDPSLIAGHVSSSGSTGPPRLQKYRQDGLAKAIGRAIAESDAAGQGFTLSSSSVGYSASWFLWLCSLAAARPILALDLLYDIGELDAALRRPDVSVGALAPSQIRRLAALPGDTPRYPNLARLVSVGGPAVPADKIAAVARLSRNYRMSYSSVGIGVISRIVGDDVLLRPTSCGRPAQGVSVAIRDGDRLCAVGEVGEIVVTTDKVTGVRPGDLGWLDADGYLHIAGRVEGLFSRNGVNFNAERLVQAALAIPDVTEAAVVALAGADGGDAIHLVVQCAADCVTAIEEEMRRTLPAVERPDHIHVRAVIPLLVSGKIDLDTLRHDIMSERMDQPDDV
jgi:acyl-coenzyme A synthetase/AMP-(fatty) acid ligase